MSRWTLIRGSMNVEVCPHSFKKNGAAYYLYPKDQFSLGCAKPYLTDSNKDAGLEFCLNVSSTPKMKAIVGKAIKHLPTGESNTIVYSVVPDDSPSSSSSDFDSKSQEKIFYELVEQQYSHDELGSWSVVELKKYLHVRLDWVNYYSRSIITISDNVRWCSAQDIFDGFEKFVNDLLYKDNVSLQDGFFFIHDEYISNYRCAIKVGFSEDRCDVVTYLILDANTNAILASKTVTYDIDWDDKTNPWAYKVSEEKSENWDELYNEIG